MQFKATVVALALAASSRVSAQGIDSLPECALNASVEAIGSTGCQLTDVKCICSNTGFITSLTPKVEQACSPEDLAKTVQAATALCKSVGVDISVPSGPSSTVSVAPGPVSESSTVAPSTTTEATSTSTEVATTTVVAGTGTGTGVPAPTTNGTITSATPTATIIPGAAANIGVQSGLLALAGAAAMFFAL